MATLLRYFFGGLVCTGSDHMDIPAQEAHAIAYCFTRPKRWLARLVAKQIHINTSYCYRFPHVRLLNCECLKHFTKLSQSNSLHFRPILYEPHLGVVVAARGQALRLARIPGSGASTSVVSPHFANSIHLSPQQRSGTCHESDGSRKQIARCVQTVVPAANFLLESWTSV